MADGASVLNGSGANPLPKSITDVLGQAAGRQGDLPAAIGSSEDQLKTADKTETDQLRRTEESRGTLTPPQLKIPDPPKVQTTNPQQIWGSMAMLLAGLGSLMTRTPLTTAMNAAADVMDSYRKGDQVAANQAFETWKQASENYIQMANFQQKAYDEAMARYDRLDRLTVEEHSNTVREIEADLRAKMTAFGDETGLQRLEMGGIHSAQELMLQRDKWKEQLLAQAPKLAENQAFMNELHSLYSDPRFQQLQQQDPIAAYRLLNQMMPSNMKPMTEEQRTQNENHIRDKIQSGPLYKAWTAAQMSDHDIDAAMSGLKNGSIPQAVVADQFTQIFNGGRAMRGFQLKMNTEHGSLWDKAQVAMNQLNRGGPLSDAQIGDMVAAAKLTVQELNRQMAGEVLSAQALAAKQHLDIDTVVPDTVMSFARDNPQAMPGISLPPETPGAKSAKAADGAKPSDKAVSYLRQHDDAQTRQFFDQKYGQGAAARALGQ